MTDHDFAVQDQGSVVLFIPQTDAAETVLDEMGLESWQFWGNGFVVDRRSAQHLVEALKFDGFSVTFIH